MIAAINAWQAHRQGLAAPAARGAGEVTRRDPMRAFAWVLVFAGILVGVGAIGRASSLAPA